MFLSEITKEEINKLDTRSFKGAIHLIDTMEDFEFHFPVAAKKTLLGFDTETRPSFKKGRINDISLIQLATSDEAWLIRINKIGIPQRLRELLESPGVLKIGAGLNDDFQKIRRLADLKVDGFMDLQKMVEEFSIESKSLKKLTAIVLGFRISKSQQISNWDANQLTPAQQTYAATDAWVCFEIYRTLQKQRNQYE